jgi:hypothetical protein
MDIEYHLNVLSIQRCEYLTKSRIEGKYITFLEKCIERLVGTTYEKELPKETLKTIRDELSDIYNKYYFESTKYYNEFYKSSSITTALCVNEDLIYECYEKMRDIFLKEDYKQYFE